MSGPAALVFQPHMLPYLLPLYHHVLDHFLIDVIKKYNEEQGLKYLVHSSQSSVASKYSKCKNVQLFLS